MGHPVLPCVVFAVSWMIVVGFAWFGASHSMMSMNWELAKPIAFTVGIGVAWVAADFASQRQRALEKRSRWGASWGAWATGLTILLLSAFIGLPYLDVKMRHRVAEMLRSTATTRDQVSVRIKSKSPSTTVGVGVSVPSHPFVAEAIVEANGTIRLRGDRQGIGAEVMVRLTPTLDPDKGEVVWACVGEPARYFPGSCR